MSKLAFLFNLILVSLVFFLAGIAVTLFVQEKYDLSALTNKLVSQKQDTTRASKTVDWQKIQNQVLPEQGFTLDVSFEDLGPKLTKVGAIDLTKFQKNFQASGGLTNEQNKILTKNTSLPITINQKNANFMVDFFWALGLTNKSPVLDQSPMVEDRSQLGNFASTGGWTLSKKSAVSLFSKYEIIKLTPEQQEIVKEVAANVFRPCCGNPTSFPDCNHGMAALGLAEYLASKGKSAEEIYRTILYFNSFWFPQNYMDVAAYFTLTGNSWSTMNPQAILGAQFSSGQGYARIKQTVNEQLGVPAPTQGGGGGCGT